MTFILRSTKCYVGVVWLLLLGCCLSLTPATVAVYSSSSTQSPFLRATVHPHVRHDGTQNMQNTQETTTIITTTTASRHLQDDEADGTDAPTEEPTEEPSDDNEIIQSNSNVIFYLLLALCMITCGAYNLCFKRQMIRSEYMRSRLFGATEHTYRQDLIASEDENASTWECDVCVFSNAAIHNCCMLCGTERGYKLFQKAAWQTLKSPVAGPSLSTGGRKGHSAKEVMLGMSSAHNNPNDEEAAPLSHTMPPQLSLRSIRRSFAKKRLNELTTRQRGARRRKDWIRQTDSRTGLLVWRRNDAASNPHSALDQRILTSTLTAETLDQLAPGARLPTLTKLDMSLAAPEEEDKELDDRASVHSVGYISECVASPSHPDGRMTFKLADGTNAERHGYHITSEIHPSVMADQQSPHRHSRHSSRSSRRSKKPPLTQIASPQALSPISTYTLNATPSTKPNAIANANANATTMASSSLHPWHDTAAMTGDHIITAEDYATVAELPFAAKHAWFVQHTAALEVPWEQGHVTITVDRKNVLHNSCEQLLWATASQLHQSLRIKFRDEPGVDAGGLEREWFTLMSHEIFQEANGLFQPHGAHGAYGLNPSSAEASEDHLMYFQAIGRFFGRALFQGVLIEGHLALPMFKHMLSMPMTFSDLTFVDEELARNLVWLRTHSGVETLSLDFSVVLPGLLGAEPTIVDMIPNGREIPVTDANKRSYIELRLKWVLVTSVSHQLASFLKGLHSVIPREYLSVFDHQELELLMCGIPDINVEDWKAHTTVVDSSIVKDNTEVLSWFWNTVDSFNATQRARLLQFATGSARVPVQGFKALTMNDGRICLFVLQLITKEECLYPRAHTCFNRLDLPRYSSEKEMAEALKLVITLDVTGFTME